MAVAPGSMLEEFLADRGPISGINFIAANRVQPEL
jgi:hypothetical protein